LEKSAGGLLGGPFGGPFGGPDGGPLGGVGGPFGGPDGGLLGGVGGPFSGPDGGPLGGLGGPEGGPLGGPDGPLGGSFGALLGGVGGPGDSFCITSVCFDEGLGGAVGGPFGGPGGPLGGPAGGLVGGLVGVEVFSTDSIADLDCIGGSLGGFGGLLGGVGGPTGGFGGLGGGVGGPALLFSSSACTLVVCIGLLDILDEGFVSGSDSSKDAAVFAALIGSKSIFDSGKSSSCGTFRSFSDLISVSPPLAFSAAYDVNTTFDGSIISLSVTFPKSPKSSLKAPANKDDPIVLASFLPCVALYS